MSTSPEPRILADKPTLFEYLIPVWNIYNDTRNLDNGIIEISINNFEYYFDLYFFEEEKQWVKRLMRRMLNCERGLING